MWAAMFENVGPIEALTSHLTKLYWWSASNKTESLNTYFPFILSELFSRLFSVSHLDDSLHQLN